ncbi:MAG: hypothetical protein ABSG61_00015 [Gemmatimonadales bacterium]|jgi:hypothetical protein
MSARIVFNGREYDGVESMPPEVRQEYERILGALGAEDRDKVASALGHGAGLKLNVTVHRKFRVGGKEYESVDAMPADVRAAYERALAPEGAALTDGGVIRAVRSAAGSHRDATAANPSLQDTSTSFPKPQISPGAMPTVPPPIDADDSRRGTLVRIAVWVVVALVVALWLLTHR